MKAIKRYATRVEAELARIALDAAGVENRNKSRSKYGSKTPKAEAK